MTTTPQVTDADRERADAFIESITEQLRNPSYGDCSYEHIKPGSDDALASELAAARREGEIAEHRRVCPICEQGGFSTNGVEEPCPRIKQLEGEG